MTVAGKVLGSRLLRQLPRSRLKRRLGCALLLRPVTSQQGIDARRGLMTRTIAVVRHQVVDFDAWKKVHDSFAPVQDRQPHIRVRRPRATSS